MTYVQEMYISTLSLQQFRNYTHHTFSFENGMNIISGENGKGKTNILEAIYTLSTTKPFRNSKKEVFLQHNSTWGKIQGTFEDEGKKEILDIFWGEGKKFQAKINDIPYKNAKDFLKDKNYIAVLFSPEDLLLPFLSPSLRRTFLSRILSPVFSEYCTQAIIYEKSLKQRNCLLKSKKDGNTVSRDEFIFWETNLTTAQEVIKKYHKNLFSFINEHIEEEYVKITGKLERVHISPIYSLEDEETLQWLENDFSIDCLRGSTSRGIHRDDFILYLRDIPLEEGASRGEVRSVILALKSIEKKFIEFHTHKKPIILLDDVFSELDQHHQNHLVESIKNHQCIITTTEINIPIQNSVHHITL